MLKNILFVIIQLFMAAEVAAQSYLAFSIGYDYSNIKEAEEFDAFWTFNEPYSSKSIFYAIAGVHHLSKKTSISINLIYTEKELKAHDGGIVALKGIKFNQVRGEVLFKAQLNDLVYLGGGPVLNYLSNVQKYSVVGTHYDLLIQSNRKYGAKALVGVKYKGFFVEPFYILGFGMGGKRDKVDFKPINSFGLSVGYMLRVSKKK